jgi:hypothetical protein
MTLVVPVEQEAAYAKWRTHGLEVVPCPAVGLHLKRPWIAQFAAARGEEYMWQMDDDLFFQRRRHDGTNGLRTIYAGDTADFRDFWDVLVETSRKYAHASVSPRAANNALKLPGRECTRAMRIHGYNIGVYQREVNQAQVPRLCEDFDVTLQLLRKGYKNLIIAEFSNDQSTSNQAGGCSDYRTLETHAASMRQLHANHPDFTTLVEKPVARWKGMGNSTRLDVNIKWQKAYLSSGAKL